MAEGDCKARGSGNMALISQVIVMYQTLSVPPKMGFKVLHIAFSLPSSQSGRTFERRGRDKKVETCDFHL